MGIYLPNDAVWNVVNLSKTFLPPVIIVLPFPSPMNIKFLFFLPTFKLLSSYLKKFKLYNKYNLFFTLSRIFFKIKCFKEKLDSFWTRNKQTGSRK